MSARQSTIAELDKAFDSLPSSAILSPAHQRFQHFLFNNLKCGSIYMTSGTKAETSPEEVSQLDSQLYNPVETNGAVVAPCSSHCYASDEPVSDLWLMNAADHIKGMAQNYGHRMHILMGLAGIGAATRRGQKLIRLQDGRIVSGDQKNSALGKCRKPRFGSCFCYRVKIFSFILWPHD